jgi:hypothetical protein
MVPRAFKPSSLTANVAKICSMTTARGLLEDDGCRRQR